MIRAGMIKQASTGIYSWLPLGLKVLKKIEHIVIDGGSKDKTLQVIKKYKNDLAYWHTKEDKGIYDAMNAGIKKSKGEIIGILNSDDYFNKNAL